MIKLKCGSRAQLCFRKKIKLQYICKYSKENTYHRFYK